jgi:calcineurin-like phosphoesterase family protein
MIHYTSDLHLGHGFVAGLRGFEDPAEHDRVLAVNWDSLIAEGDQVWVLGDLSVGGKRRELAALEWIAQRPGVKHLVSGNHDSTFPMHSDAHKWQAIYLREAFASVQSVATRKIGGRRVLLSHFPYAGSDDGDHTAENRFEEWRLPDIGRWLLHGHTHNAEQVLHGRQIHIGLDAHNLRPVSESWVEKQIAEAE